MSKLYKIYDEQPKVVKTMIVLAGTLIAGYAIFTIFQKIKKSGGLDKGVQDASKELKDLEKANLRPSYSDTQFEVFASSLHKAMKDNGTDEETVFRVFRQMKTKADVLKLIQVYGKRPETGGIWAGHFSDQDLSLAEQLNSDFDDSDIQEINKILKGKGINFQFT
jgi:hypothetical protein